MFSANTTQVASNAATYIEDVFSTWLYTGNGSAQGIPNGIALANGAGGGTSTEFVTGASLTKTSDLTGDADGQTTTVSFWIKTTAANGEIFINQNSRYVLNIQGGLFWFYGKNTGDTTIVNFKSSIAINTGAWVNVIFSFDLSSTSLRSVYINDVADTGVTWTTYTNATMDRATTTGSWFLGNIGAVPCKIANFYMANTYTDLSVTANRRYFIDADGTEAAAATTASLSPILYLPLTAGYSTGQNLGTGGNFTAYLSTPAVVSDGPANFIQGYGGLVWLKQRSLALDHLLMDSARGATNYLSSNTTSAQNSGAPVTFSSTGLSIASGGAFWNQSSDTYASWTFRKQPKFFDVVTYTGTGSVQNIAHSLGSAPGFIIVKSTNGAGDWWVYHRSLGATQRIQLNDTFAASSNAAIWNNTEPTSTVFTVGASSASNNSGTTYVAYLFAHNAGGFGLTGTDNVISCGSFTGPAATVTLGYEPQWILFKNTANASDWLITDNMRGMPTLSGLAAQELYPNKSNAESYGGNFNAVNLYPTGFSVGAGFSGTYIYIAIRRGPMKVPTDGTTVFVPITSSGSTGTVLTTNFPVDMLFTKYRSGAASNPIVDRLRGVSSNSTEKGIVVYTNSTGAESGTTGESLAWNNTGFQIPSNWGGISNAFEAFRRAPSFFDEVCYTGTGSATTFNHNLGVAPEMMWVKRRNTTGTWRVYASGLTSAGYALTLNSAATETSLPTVWNSTAPTSSVFSVGTSTDSNASGSTYVAYLFASCPGVSKCTAFTGNGSTQTINCGFTSGARFVLIKATSTTGNWLCFDTARGMTTSTDPWLALNLTSAESATSGACTTTAVGFTVDESKLTGINTNGTSYIALAIA